VHLQLFIATSKIPIPKLGVVVFIRDLTQEIDAVELVEDFETDSVTFDSSLGMLGSQVGFWHPDDFKFFICDDLVADCRLLVWILAVRCEKKHTVI
jgi:hypothetical protein